MTLALGFAAVQKSDAAITYTFEEVGPNVTMTIVGSFDLTGLIETAASNQFGDVPRIVVNGTGTRDRIEIGAGINVETNIFSGLVL